MRLLNDETGAAAAEYALILALIAVVIIGVLSVLGVNISSVFSTIAATLTPAS
jgi:pilus assembly protein Flp/PilA